MSIAVLIQLLTTILNLAPLALQTVQGIKELLAKDPNTPADLAAILLSTQEDNQATLAAVQAWLNANPQ